MCAAADDAEEVLGALMRLLLPGLHSETGGSMALALEILPVRAINPFSTALPIWGQNKWKYNRIV